MDKIDSYLVSLFGFENAVRIEEFFTWSSGFLSGAILSFILFCNLAMRIKIDYDIHSDTLFKASRGKKKWIIINPKSPLHIMEAMYCALLWNVKKDGFKKDMEFKTEAHKFKRIKRILIMLLLIAIALIILGIAFALDIVVDTQ